MVSQNTSIWILRLCVLDWCSLVLWVEQGYWHTSSWQSLCREIPKCNHEDKLPYTSKRMANTDKLRICGYFVVSDLHKITEADIRFCSEDLFDEIANHDEWILESIVWDANHKIDTNREGLNIILEKAKNDEFDILLLHHVTLISRSVTKTFDYALQLYKGKNPSMVSLMGSIPWMSLSIRFNLERRGKNSGKILRKLLLQRR